MSAFCIEIGLIVARRRVHSAWTDHVWLVRAALPAVPVTPVGTVVFENDQESCHFAGSARLMLHPALTAHYCDNLMALQPSVWVQLRTDGDSCRVCAATVDPYEGEAMGDGFATLVEAVAMPFEIQRQLQAFIATFHVERPFVKRQRRSSVVQVRAAEGGAA